MALLAARGFSLVQIGFAETVFHIASLTFEIPSGMLADIYGRKKMLIASQVLGALACTIMAISNGFPLVCVAMACTAIGYNFESGSEEALIYDSLKSVNRQGKYERISSNQMIIYRLGGAISTLCAGLSLFMGYQLAYAISAVTHLVVLVLTFGLVEVKITSEDVGNERTKCHSSDTSLLSVTKKVARHFADSIKFLIDNTKATKLMFANSLVGAVDVLLLFSLQAKVPETGISKWLLGLRFLLCNWEVWLEPERFYGQKMSVTGKSCWPALRVCCLVCAWSIRGWYLPWCLADLYLPWPTTHCRLERM